MLDSFSALGVASNIISTVDFASRVIKGTIEIAGSHDGALTTHRDLDVIAKNMELPVNQVHHGSAKLSGLRQESSPALTGIVTYTTFARDQDSLQVLAESCRDLVNELLGTLQNVKSSDTSRKWSNLRRALLSVWKEKEIDAYARRLASFQGQIVTRLSVTVVDRQSDVLQALESLSKKLGTLDCSSALTIQALRSELFDWADETSKGRQSIHQSLTNLDVTLQNVAVSGKSMTKYALVLDSLRDATMFEREIAISEAHARTFEWALSVAPTNNGRSNHVDFYMWLRHGLGFFWINGKAGAGKSTLMKFLLSNPQTRQALQHWSDEKKLLLAKHFFWRAGTDIQRSQRGLLQSLLLQILSQWCEIIPLVCPARWEALEDVLAKPNQPWALKDLLWAFDLIQQQRPKDMRICVFVDGLDEYDGDQYDLVDFLKQMSSSTFIKICGSSRPWNAFVDVLDHDKDQQLVLQELTHRDIAIYVKAKLQQEHRFSQLQTTAVQHEDLITEVVSRAQGVFLWVYLVVRSLKRGMANCDTVEELRARLRLLPTDLYDYFQQMLDAVEEVYRPQTAKILQLCLRSPVKLTSLTLSFFDEDSVDFAIDMSVNPGTPQQRWVREVWSIRRLRARCADLLEIVQTPNEEPQFGVHFLHRTVRDFLEENEVQSLVLSQLAHRVDPLEMVCAMFLAQAKIYDPNSPASSQAVCNILDIAFLLGKNCRSQLHRILDALELILVKRRAPKTCASMRRFAPFMLGVFDSIERDVMLRLALCVRIDSYVRYKVEQDSSFLRARAGDPLLRTLVGRGLHGQELRNKGVMLNDINMPHFFLDHGADPNHSVETPHYDTVTPELRETVWTESLHLAWKARNSEGLFEMMMLFLQYGADPYVHFASPFDGYGDLAPVQNFLHLEDERCGVIDVARLLQGETGVDKVSTLIKSLERPHITRDLQIHDLEHSRKQRPAIGLEQKWTDVWKATRAIGCNSSAINALRSTAIAEPADFESQSVSVD